MTAKQMMRAKLNDFQFKRWSKLNERSETLIKRRESMGLEGMKIAKLENELFNELASFWRMTK